MEEIAGQPQDQIYDIYDFWFEPFWQTRWFKITMLLLAILIFVVLAYFLWRKFFGPKKIESWEKALKELKVLKKDFLVGDAESFGRKKNKQFYFELISCLKNYLNLRYNIKDFGKTDAEMVVILNELHVPAYVSENVELIFVGAMTIKFANQQVAKKQMEDDWARAVRLIQDSIPKKDSI